jgi:Xaa-Pro dipeptidase
MIIATTTVNFAYLTGVWLETYERFKAAVKCGDHLAAVVPALDAGRMPGEVYSYRDGEDPAEALRQAAAGCDASVIYIDGGTALRHFEIVKRAFPMAEYRLGDHIFREWRAVKRRDEVEKIRAAASAIRRAMEGLELAPGVSERQAAARIYLTPPSAPAGRGGLSGLGSHRLLGPGRWPVGASGPLLCVFMKTAGRGAPAPSRAAGG